MKKTVFGIVIIMLLLPEMMMWTQANSKSSIDVYTQYPYPNGGQGPNMPSHPFGPQDEVLLFALVTYSLAPVENKMVTFTIIDPSQKILSIRTAASNRSGIASISLRLPWPAQNVFGNWSVLGTVDIANEVCKDTLTFEVHDRKIGDLGGDLPPQFFAFDNTVDSKDFALFMLCYRGSAPAEAMYLGDLGGGSPLRLFEYDGLVDGKDLALFLICHKGSG
jgi:hypothetical protein